MANKLQSTAEDRRVLIDKAVKASDRAAQAEEALVQERVEARKTLSTCIQQERDLAWTEIWGSLEYALEVSDYYQDGLKVFFH